MARHERQNKVCNSFIDNASAVGLGRQPIIHARVYFVIVPSREQPHITVNGDRYLLNIDDIIHKQTLR